MQSLRSRTYVTESFTWNHYYWYLTNEGINYLREFLHLPEEIVPATLKKKPAPVGTRLAGPGSAGRGAGRRGFDDGDRPQGAGRGRTAATGEQNKIPLNPITCDLSGPLSPRLRHSVDIILFNPPYVPTDHDEASYAQDSAGIAGSWAGGADGMEITNRFLDNVGDLLSDRGKFYLVALAQNNIPGIRQKMQNSFHLNSEVVIQRRAGRENLHIVRFSRSEGNV